MLNRKYRLTKRKQFNYIYRRGRSSHGELLTLVYCGSKLRNVKIGFSASKKVGNSVVRHRSIRLMREAVRPLVPHMAPNNSYIFVAKEELKGKSLIDIKKNIMHVLKKANLILQDNN